MPLQISCPKCAQQLKVPDQHRGKRVKCPGCATVLAVGGEPSSTAAASQPNAPVATPPSAAAASPPKITLACNCGTKLKVDASARGKQVQCPRCKQHITVPQTTAQPSAGSGVAAAGAAASPFVDPNEDPFVAPPTSGATSGATAAAPDPFADLPSTPTQPAGDMWADLPTGQQGFPASSPQGFPAVSPAAAPAANPFPASPAAQPAAAPAANSAMREQAALASAGGYGASLEERQAQATLSGPEEDGGFFDDKFHIALVAMIFLGPVIGYFSYQSKMRYDYLMTSGVQVDGVVTDGWVRRGRKFRRSYYLEVEYAAEDGEEYWNDFKVNSSYYDETDLGAKVPIAYDPNDPDEAILVGISSDSQWGIYFGVGMTLFGVLGTGWVIYSNFAGANE